MKKKRIIQSMISFEEALAVVRKSIHKGDIVLVPIAKAIGMAVARVVKSPSMSPPFDQSAMDGYAIRYQENYNGAIFQCAGILPAGSSSKQRLKSNDAVRIFTGAALPAGADTVIPQEYAVIQKDKVSFSGSGFSKGSNVRKKGSHIRKGVVLLRPGDIINPGTAALLASVGISEVPVRKKPDVGIVVTGNELCPPGKSLKPGQIYESNSVALTASLLAFGIAPVKISFANDNERDLIAKISRALKSVDVLLLTGGVSVGDFDLVGPALIKLGARICFHKVKQKPGKPFLFANHNHKIIFALPGNPGAVLACFHTYVASALLQHGGLGQVPEKKVCLTHPYTKKTGLTHILKARQTEKGVEILDGQESYKVDAFAKANSLVILDESSGKLNKGDLVRVWKIRN